ncbi:MAG: Glutathione transport system permease protein GsiC [Pseudomonadota bacterium]|jgi:peptide/nickel transport system permease protein
MLRLLSVRLAQAAPVLLLVAVLAFLLMRLLPGDPAIVIAGPDASPEAVDRLRRQLGLDRPVLAQLGAWFGHLAQGDFGRSLMLNQTVVSAVLERLPVTLSLAALAFAITLPVGTALGVLAACFRNTWIDACVMAVALVGVSVPSFWIAIVSVIVFSVELGWLPSSGYAPLSRGAGPWLHALIQPAAILALFQIGYLARMTRSAMLDVLDQDYIRTARAKGLDEWRTIGRHAFRNALMSVTTVSGIIVSLLIGGSVVIEQVFALPGIGRLVVQGIMARDYPLVQGTMLMLGFAFVLVNVAVDVIYTIVDPRVRYD